MLVDSPLEPPAALEVPLAAALALEAAVLAVLLVERALAAADVAPVEVRALADVPDELVDDEVELDPELEPDQAVADDIVLDAVDAEGFDCEDAEPLSPLTVVVALVEPSTASAAALMPNASPTMVPTRRVTTTAARSHVRRQDVRGVGASSQSNELAGRRGVSGTLSSAAPSACSCL